MGSSAEAEVRSLKAFVRNVVDFEGLYSELMAVAQAELGPSASLAEEADRAGGLLLEALLSVGIDPKTELVKRDLLKQALRGDLMSEADLQTAVLLYSPVTGRRATTTVGAATTTYGYHVKGRRTSRSPSGAVSTYS